MTFSLAFLTASNAIQFFLAGKTTEINESAHQHFTKPKAIASMIALQVVRISFGFHLRECMGSCFPPLLLLRDSRYIEKNNCLNAHAKW